MAAAAAAPAAGVDGEAVVVAARFTLERNDLRPAAASGTLVGQYDALLLAFGAEAAVDGIELLLFLFEVVDVDRDRTDENNEQEKQQIDIDGILLMKGCRF